MKRIGLAAGIVLLAFLATVAVGNHSVVRADMPARVEWKAVPYGPVTVPAGTQTLASIMFTVPEAGFVWLNSTGSCFPPPTPVPLGTVLVSIHIGWRSSAIFPPFFILLPGDAFYSISTTSFADLPYSASAVFPVPAGTNTLFLQMEEDTISPFSCSGVNVVMFTNTQLP